jgi:hypothetical protein
MSGQVRLRRIERAPSRVDELQALFVQPAVNRLRSSAPFPASATTSMSSAEVRIILMPARMSDFVIRDKDP